jgi:hypothetical protein
MHFIFMGLKQGDALITLLSNFALEYVVRKIQENKERQELNGIHQLLIYADDVNLLDENTNTIKKNNEAASDASKESGVEANAEKTKRMFMYHGISYCQRISKRECVLRNNPECGISLSQ